MMLAGSITQMAPNNIKNSCFTNVTFVIKWSKLCLESTNCWAISQNLHSSCLVIMIACIFCIIMIAYTEWKVQVYRWMFTMSFMELMNCSSEYVIQIGFNFLWELNFFWAYELKNQSLWFSFLNNCILVKIIWLTLLIDMLVNSAICFCTWCKLLTSPASALVS